MRKPLSSSMIHHWRMLSLATVFNPPAHYFFHIPKTAGTSLRVLLDQQFEQSQICTAYSIVPLLKMSRSELRSFHFFRGHLYNLLFHIVPGRLKTFTLLRDPIERSLSHWDHIRRIPSHYFHERSHRQGSLQAFLEDPETRPMIENFQARALVLDADPRQLASRYTQSELDQFVLDRDFESLMLPELSPAELLRRAIKKVDSFAFVGLTERFEQSITQMFNQFGWNTVPTILHENVSPVKGRRAGLTARELTLLEELTSVDRQLYSYVENLLNNRPPVVRNRAG